jgi:osmotically-inducible protein OsmY
MANQQHGNGRTPSDDERLAARDRERMGPQWDDRSARSDDREDRNRSTEYYGQGQSGYGSGRDERDHAFGSRNQMNPIDDERHRDRGTDERFAGGRGGPAWSPDDRGTGRHPGGGGYGQGREGYGNQSNYGSAGNMGAVGGAYGHQGNYSGQGGGYLAQSGQQMSARDRDEMIGGRGAQGHGGMYGQGGYNEGMYGRGGMQHRYGSQGYQGWGQGQHGGGMRGKGPSGYTRSDDRIRENVCEALMEDDDVDATHIDVTVKNGEVTLSGTVEDRRQKRMAEDCVENLAGVHDVVNQLRIGAGNGHTSTQASSDKRHRA